MSVIGSNVLAGASGGAGAGDYAIERSLRFNSGDSAYLNRTPSAAGNRKTWTWSGWVKRTNIGGVYPRMFGNYTGGSYIGWDIEFNNSDKIDVHYSDGSSYVFRRTTTAVYRDPSAWYHIVVAVDTTQSTANDRLKLYVNGVQVTAFDTTTNVSQNYDTNISTAVEHRIGYNYSYSDFYLADVHFIDGQALDSSSFGQTNTDNLWVPIAYAGTYGTNGFRLEFADNSGATATTLGKDTSGGSNNWTPNNLSVTAGAGNDSLFDTPTNGDTASDTGAGGEITGCYATMNPLSPSTTNVGTYANGNLEFTHSGNYATAVASIGMTSGKWYCEVTKTSTGTNTVIGVHDETAIEDYLDRSAAGYGWRSDGLKVNGNQGHGNIGGYAEGDVMGLAFDADAKALYFYKNGSLVGSFTGITPSDATHFFAFSVYDGKTIKVNFGQRAFAYPPNTGPVYSDNASTSGSTSTGTKANAFNGSITDYWQTSANASQTYTFSLVQTGTLEVYQSGTGTEYDIAINGGSASSMTRGASNGWETIASNASTLTSVTFTRPRGSNNQVATWAFRVNGTDILIDGLGEVKTLSTASLPTPTIADGSKYFDTSLWTGNGTQTTVSGLEFSPSFVWIKSRSTAAWHMAFDVIRGVQARLHPNETNQEQTGNNDLTAFNSDGYTLDNNSAPANTDVNGSGTTYVGWAWDAGANSDRTYTVTVSGGNFYIDGAQQPTLTLAEGSTYKFDQSASTNATHPLRFSTTSDGTHGGGTEYTTGVTTAGTPGSAGAYTQIVIAASAPTLYAYCTNHSGMGFQVNTSDKGGYTIPVGVLNSSTYDQSQNWTNLISFNAGGWNGNGTNPFDADATNTDYGDTSRANGGYATLDVSSLTGSRVISVTSEQTEVTITHAGGTTTYTPTTTSRLTHTFAAVTNPTSIKFDGLNSNSQFVLVGVTVDGARLINSGISLANVPSIASQVMANPSAGFSIVSYTGTGSAGTIGHGLNAAPEFLIVKNRTSAGSWFVYHKSIGATKYLKLETTDAEATGALWNNTEPTSSVVSSSGSSTGSSGQDYLMLAFAPVAGYSAMGSYTGNGSTDGSFVFTGFKIAWLLIKRTDATKSWQLIDNARSTFNVTDDRLFPDDTGAESSGSNFNLDFLSNGFKCRTAHNSTNESGATYVYLAFASNPFASNGGLAR